MTRWNEPAWILLCGLCCLPGLACAEPVAAPPEQPGAAQPQVWGDPEEGDASEKNWTWFGMGFERRMRAVEEQNLPEGEASPPSGGKPGRPGR